MRLSGILLIVIIVISGIGYWYYQSSQATIAKLTENNTKLVSAVETQEVAMTSLQESYRRANEQLKQTNQELADSRRQNRRLSDKLANIDLGMIALENPEGIQRAVNNGTARAARCFELLSGAEMNQREKEATDGESFNQECPWLWPGTADADTNSMQRNN